MTATERFIYNHLHLLRRITQYFALVVIFIIPALNKFGYTRIIGTYYSISIGNLDIVDPALMLQSFFLTKKIFFPLLVGAVIPLIISLFFGKVFCSWACPFNLLAEYTDRLRKIIRPKSTDPSYSNPASHHYWIIFGSILLLTAILGIPIITFVSFPGLMSGQVADLVFAGTLGIELFLIVFVLLLELFFAPRFWCKYACPVGATLALFHWRRTLKIGYHHQNCVYAQTKTLACNDACPIHLNPMKAEIYPYCYNCGECVDACRKCGGSALMFTFK